MKDFIRELISKVSNPIQKRNLVREYLQARILESLQRSEAMIPLAFLGGTALRFLYIVSLASPKTWIFHWKGHRHPMISNLI